MPKYKFERKEKTVHIWTDYYEEEGATEEEALENVINYSDPVDSEIDYDPIETMESYIVNERGEVVYKDYEEVVIDNSEITRSFIEKLKNPNDFIWVQVIQRKKDHNDMLPSNGMRIVKSFSFFNVEKFDKDLPYIKYLCEKLNARAYFWVNPKNTFDVTCEALCQYAKLIKENNTHQGLKVWDSACSLAASSQYDKLWIVDIDTKDVDILNKYIDIINSCRGSKDRIKYQIPTLNGYHLLCTGFDRIQFTQKVIMAKLDKVEIQTNNPSLMYYKK